MITKREIITHLENIASFMEYLNENQFKTKSFSNAANSIRLFTGSFEEIAASGNFGELKGVGKTILPVITEYVDSQSSDIYEKLSARIPESVQQMFDIRGLGPKKLSVLVEQEGIDSIEKLLDAIKQNKVAEIKGFGTKTQEKLLTAIENLMEAEGKFRLDTVDSAASEIEERLFGNDEIIKFSRTGELRRIQEVCTKIEYVVHCNQLDTYNRLIKSIFPEAEISGNLVRFTFSNIPVYIYICSSETEFCSTLFKSTGSPEFLAAVNYSQGNESDEEQIFARLGHTFYPAEMREVRGDNTLAPAPEKELISPGDLKGHFHFHTVLSDGHNTLEQMVSAAAKLNFTHSVVCDHSRSAAYAGGLTEYKIELQKAEVAALQEKGFKIFRGIESDILRNGELDYPEEILREFALIVASVHSATSLDEGEMTARMIKAVENPYTDILAHPTGRILLKRDAYAVDIKKVIDACAANGVAIEINANPKRLDLDWRHIEYARNKGTLFAINPDAHDTTQIEYIKYGVMIARKGGLTPEEVINCYDFNAFKKFANRKVTRSF